MRNNTYKPSYEFLEWFRKTYKEGIEYPTKGNDTVSYDKLPSDMRALMFTQALHDYHEKNI